MLSPDHRNLSQLRVLSARNCDKFGWVAVDDRNLSHLRVVSARNCDKFGWVGVGR